MEEIAKCPICGSPCVQTKIKSFNTFVSSHIEWSCSKCKKAPVFRTKKSWNQYAAAMGLARGEYAVRTAQTVSASVLARDKRFVASDRVLEVFGDNDE